MNATKTMDSNDPSGEAMPDAMLLQTALCYLMTRYTLWPCSGLACTIVHRLHLLSAHPDLAGRPELGKIHHELLQHWQNIVTRQPASRPIGGISPQRGAAH